MLTSMSQADRPVAWVEGKEPAAAVVLARVGTEAAMGPALEMPGIRDDVLEHEARRDV